MSAKPMGFLDQAAAEREGAGQRAGRLQPVMRDSASERLSDHLADMVSDTERLARPLPRHERPKPAQIGVSIEAALVPRLLLAHRRVERAASAPAAFEIEPEVENLARFVIIHDLDGANGLIEDLRSQGASVEQIYLDLLTPTARQLGERWDDDRASFAEVTTGLICLHHLLHTLGPSFHQGGFRPDCRRRALICPTPGDQHMFGASMVAEFLRRAGWDVVCCTVASEAELSQRVQQDWFGIVGISVSCNSDITVLASMIRRARHLSVNRSLGVMVGGPVFLAHPELVALVGADTTASDGRHAAIQAEGLLSLLVSPP